jgi:hypothetical protein
MLRSLKVDHENDALDEECKPFPEIQAVKLPDDR